MDYAVFAGVAPRGDRWIMRGSGCLGVCRLRGEGAGLFWWGWGLLLGSFKRKPLLHGIMNVSGLNNHKAPCLTSADHVWTRPSGPSLRLWGSHCKVD